MQRTTHNAGEGSGTGKPAGMVFTVGAAGAISDMPSKYFKDVKKRYETGQVLTDVADVVEFHVERLSMHGLPRALDTKHSFLTRLVFTIMTIVAAGAAMYFCAISVREYRKYSYSVVEKVSPVINGTLPALVFCSLEPHIYEFDQEDWLAHAVELEYVTFEEGEELLAKGDFHTQTFAKDLALQRALTSCSVETNSGTMIEDCGVGSKLYQSGFWNVTYSRNVGYCLHYNSKGQAAELALGNPSALVLRLDPRFNMSSETESDLVDSILQNSTGSESLLIATAASSEIGLDAWGVAAYEPNKNMAVRSPTKSPKDGILAVDFSSNVYPERERTERLGKPWNQYGCVREEGYIVEVCESRCSEVCRILNDREACLDGNGVTPELSKQCQELLSEYQKEQLRQGNMTAIVPAQMKCDLNAVECENECERPCSDLTYNIKVDVGELSYIMRAALGMSPSTGYDGSSHIVVKLSDFETDREESASMSLVTLFGVVGGYLGLFVGISMISMVEVFILVSQLLAVLAGFTVVVDRNGANTRDKDELTSV